MKIVKASKPAHKVNGSFLSKLRDLKPNSDECMVLSTAMEWRTCSSLIGSLGQREKMRFTTRNSDNGTVLVWRVK